MSNTSNDEEVGVGDSVCFIDEVKGNTVHVLDGYAEAKTMIFPIGTIGIVQTVDRNERVVVRIPMYRKNGYDLVGVSKSQYYIAEKNNRRDVETEDD